MTRRSIVISFTSIFIILFISLYLVANNFNNKIETKYRTTLTFDVSYLTDLYNYTVIKDRYTNTFFDDILSWTQKRLYKGEINSGEDLYEITFDHSYFSPSYFTFFIDINDNNDDNIIVEDFKKSFIQKIKTYKSQLDTIGKSFVKNEGGIGKVMSTLSEFNISDKNFELTKKMNEKNIDLSRYIEDINELKTNKNIDFTKTINIIEGQEKSFLKIMNRICENNTSNELTKICENPGTYISLNDEEILGLESMQSFNTGNIFFNSNFIKQIIKIIYDQELKVLNQKISEKNKIHNLEMKYIKSQLESNEKFIEYSYAAQKNIDVDFQYDLILIKDILKKIENIDENIPIIEEKKEIYKEKYSDEFLLLFVLISSVFITIIITLIIINFRRNLDLI